MADPLDDIQNVARQLTRDFGTPFDVNYSPNVGGILRLPNPLVDAASVVVLNNDDGSVVADTEYAVNDHIGELRLKDSASYAGGITVQGIYYSWFLDSDLRFYTEMMVTEHLHHRPGFGVNNLHGAEIEVIGIGALVLALQALLTELSTELDVVSPEGVNIPAHQRYAQVQQLIGFWTAKYDEKAAMLNVGLKRIETFDLRRVSRLTNRLVPVYRPRELDNHSVPVRVRPPIDPIADTGLEAEEEYWQESHGDVGDAADSSVVYGQGW